MYFNFLFSPVLSLFSLSHTDSVELVITITSVTSQTVNYEHFQALVSRITYVVSIRDGSAVFAPGMNTIVVLGNFVSFNLNLKMQFGIRLSADNFED